MIKTNLNIANEFVECERENLRQTGALQAGTAVFVFKEHRCVASGGQLASVLLTEAEQMYAEHSSALQQLSHIPSTISFAKRDWFVHQHAGYILAETNDTLEHGFTPISEAEFESLTSHNSANVWKLSDRICQMLAQKVRPARVLIYKFHNDWSGEVIAERVTGDLEQFLGLRYPATDIPKIARELYKEIKTRHLFNLLPSSDLVALSDCEVDIHTIDLTYCISRSISPFHVEYLKNMGSMSTQSSAIVVDDKLWGLVSLHFSEERPCSLQEFNYFQTFTQHINTIYQTVIKAEEKQLIERSNVALGRFAEKIDNDVEPFHTLILSDVALYKIIGGQGMTLIIDSDVTNVGLTPLHEEIRQLVAFANESLDLGEHFFTELPSGISCSNGVAGLAFYIVSHDPITYFMVYRKEINQTISWGGDPRHQTSTEQTNFRYSPRKSFQKWVEEVDGQSAPWSVSQKSSFHKVFNILSEHLEIPLDDLSILLKNGMRRAVKRREQIRNSASEFIDSISSGIAIGIEKGGQGTSEILAINNVASESFNVSLGELIGTPFEKFMLSLGITELDNTQVGQSFTISTANYGVREVEFRKGILFDYINLDRPNETSVKLIVYEFTDITEATRIKKSLIAARDRAISENKLRNEMIAKLSHELKTPLHGLIGLSDLLKMRFVGDISAKEKQIVDSLQKSAYLMKDVIDYTLKSSTLIDTIDNKNFCVIDVHSLIQDIINIVQPLADKHEIEIIFECSNCVVYAEPRGIRQVLINIFENAIKYNVYRGKVRISCSETEYGQVQITITDTGVGMTEEEKKRCIEPYQRFSNKEGSGLGLPIAESLVRAMGGHLEISSTKNVGTTMVIRLSQFITGH